MLKELIGKIVFGYKYSSDSYIKHLRKSGMKIGENVTIYSPRRTIIDEQKPFMIDIGDNVKITQGVVLLTHGYDWAVLKKLSGAVLGSAGKIKIGNNVFIGMNSIILKGVTIGDNVIIGAGSVVTKNIPSNSVYAGNPAKYITNIEEYYKKREEIQIKEAQEIFECYQDVYGKVPPKEVFREFFELFEKETEVENLLPVYREVLKLENNYEESVEYYKKHTKSFKDYSEFIDECKKCFKNK